MRIGQMLSLLWSVAADNQINDIGPSFTRSFPASVPKGATEDRLPNPAQNPHGKPLANRDEMD